MKQMLAAGWVLLFLIAGTAQALEVTSLAPTQGAPGTLVMIGGGPFSATTEIFLGETAVPPRAVLPNQIEIAVPFQPAGQYALTVRDQDSIASGGYRFDILAPTPQITSITPRTLDICTTENEHPLDVNGQNFLAGAVVLLDGTAVPSRVIDITTIEARLPRIQQPGIHGIAIRNPDGATSLPLSLSVNNIPEIDSVERGADTVNAYEMVIHGKNFQFDSILVVNEPQTSTLGQASQQLSFVPRRNTAAQEDPDNLTPQRNHLIFVDCRTLIYRRLPSSFQNKDLSLQVFNPDGGHTGLIHVTLP